MTDPQDPEQGQETGTVVYVLHMPGKTYIGQPRPIEPEPEPGQ